MHFSPKQHPSYQFLKIKNIVPFNKRGFAKAQIVGKNIQKICSS
jgi:hypothetical protein